MVKRIKSIEKIKKNNKIFECIIEHPLFFLLL